MWFWTRLIRFFEGNSSLHLRLVRRRPAKRRTGFRLFLEPLEDRFLPASSLLSALHLGTAAGSTDYVYTSGNTIFPTGSVDAGKYYDLVVTDTLGVKHTVVSRTATNPFTLANDSYTVKAGDPASGSVAWKFTLHEYANATTATISKTSSKSFYVAQASMYSNSALTTAQSYFGAGATAYVKTIGLKPSQKGWSTTWYLPDGTTIAASNTVGGLPATNNTGTLASGSYLQYAPRPQPNTGTDQWNWQSSYETTGSPAFQPFGSGNQGTWFLKLQKDATDFVTLPVFTVDTTAPALATITNPPGPITVDASSYVIAGSVTDNLQLAKVQIYSGSTLVGSQTVSGTSAEFSLAVPLTQNQANNFQVVVTDVAGNSSTTSVPTITEQSTVLQSATVANPSSTVLTNSSTYTITGTAPANSLVQVWQDSNNDGLIDNGETAHSQQLSGGATNFSILVPLSLNTDNTFKVICTNASNIQSAAVLVPTITQDSIAPAAPSITDPPGAVIVTDSFYVISGSAEANSLVQIYRSGTLIGSQQLSSGSTDFSISVGLVLGAANNLTATATDAAGNVSASATVPTITQDATVPASPLVATPGAPVAVNTSSFAISGTALAGALVKVWVDKNNDGVVDGSDSVVSSQQLAAGATAYSINVPLTLNTDNNFLVTATDSSSVQSNAADVPTITEDNIKPTSSASALPASTNSTALTITYTASDNSGGSGLNEVDLYVKGPSDSSYSLASTDPNVTFSFTYDISEGDGTYSFFTRAFDNAGNSENVANSAQASTLVTAAKPSSSANALPASTNSTSITVGYTAVDNGGSGLKKVELYVAGPTDGGVYQLAGTDNSPAASGNSFGYTATEGDGTYSFYTLAYDNAGNIETVPGSADTSVVVDTVTPSSSADTLPASTNSTKISVGYTASDAVPSSGLQKVELYVAGPTDGGVYQLAGTDSSPAPSGNSFSYAATEGDGTYSFYTLAYDNAGNVEAAPAGADTSIVLDTLPPTSSANALAANSNSTTISVAYTASDADPSSGLQKVQLYVAGPTDGGVYQLAGTDSSPAASGHSISYTASEGDGTYSFYTIAFDNAGNVEAAHLTADTSTLLDTVAPTSQPSISGFDSASGIFTVSYTASDNGGGSGLQELDLYAKGPTDAGYSKVASTTTALTSGSFDYQTSGSGSYSFYTVAIDQAGNVQANTGAPLVTVGGDETVGLGDSWSRTNNSFSDAGTAWTATVDYGDGSGTQNLTLNGQSFDLTHSWGTDGTYTVLVTVTNINGGTGTALFTITVSSVPFFKEGPDVTVNENAGPQTFTGWATGIRPFSDPTLAFQVTDNSNPGLFSVGPALASNGTLSFTPANDANGTATITVVLQGGGGSSAAQRFVITVNPVNQPPSFTAGPDETVAEDSGPQTFTGWATNVSAGPANEQSQGLTFIVTGNSNSGLFSTPPAISAGGTLTFTSAHDANGSALITVVLKDTGGTDNGGVDTSASQSFTINVTPVNDAPVLDNSVDPALAPIPRNSTNPPGALISALLGTSISDVDGPGQGIAVINTGNAAQGTWQFLPASSTTWQSIGTVSPAAALLLLPTDSIRFVPATGFVGDVALTYRAWDQSTGTAHGSADASVVGGSTAFSTAVDSFTQKVAMTLRPVKENIKQPAGTKVTNFVSSLFKTANPTSKGIAIVGLTTGLGTWQYSLNGGLTYKTMPIVSQSNALLLRNGHLVRFIPAHNYFGVVTITYFGWTGTGGRAGTTKSIPLGGQLFSAASDFSMEVVVHVNQRPVLAHGTPVLTAVSSSDTNPAGDLVSSFASALISDVDGPGKGIAVVAQTGAAHGTWQYSLDNGQTWQKLGPVSATSARLLRDTDKIRFLPNAGFVGKATISFKAWDQFSGVAGSLRNPIGNPFSTATDTAQVSVT
jgi:hypothetical protein